MSWLQILILGVAVGFGEIFPLSGPVQKVLDVFTDVLFVVYNQ